MDSEGSRSGSSLSLRAMAPGVGGAGQPAPSPAHTGGGGGHRGVQRSISATSSNKPRRGSTGADNTCELMSGAGGGTVGGDGEGGQGRSWLIDVSTGPGSLGGIFSFKIKCGFILSKRLNYCNWGILWWLGCFYVPIQSVYWMFSVRQGVIQLSNNFWGFVL